MNKIKISIVLGIMCFALTFGIFLQIKTVENSNMQVSQNYEENNLRAEVLKFKEKYDNKLKEVEKAEETLDIEELKTFEEKMYGDVWNKEAYLNWMYENLMAIKSIMSDSASIYVHLDWHISHYVKILLDEIFGEDNFLYLI